MPSFYPYLISSLPSLSFGMKPPLPFNDFLERSRGFISEGDINILASVPFLANVSSCACVKNDILRKWISFDTMIRNELVKVRAARKKLDPAKYLREDGCPESSYSAHIAINAYRKPGILDAERSLDLERWRVLEDFQVGHYFDLDVLIIYGIKLLILEKWDKVSSADTEKLLEEAVGKV